MTLLDPDFLRRLEYLTLVAKQAHPGPLPALRATSLYGHGLEFADHQPYLPGDDLRYLDWNVYARHGHLLLKRFTEERDLRVDILIDVSRSMSVGEPSKLEAARRLAAALAYMALAGQDRVSLTAVADRVVARFPTTRGKGQIVSLLRFLQGLECSGATTQLEQGAAAVGDRPEGGGVVILISDFYDVAGFARAIARFRYRRFEVYALQVLTPDEVTVAWQGDVELEDVETGEVRPWIIHRGEQQRYQNALATWQRQLMSLTRPSGIGFLTVQTNWPLERFLTHSMREAGWTTTGGLA